MHLCHVHAHVIIHTRAFMQTHMHAHPHTQTCTVILIQTCTPTQQGIHTRTDTHKPCHTQGVYTEILITHTALTQSDQIWLTAYHKITR